MAKRGNRGALHCAVASAFCLLFMLAASAARADDPFPDPPSWVADQTLYEVYLRQFSAAGNVQGLRDQLQRLKDMGVGTLWIMPTNPIGVQDRIGSLGSPYAVKDYTAFNPELGSISDFKAAVDQAHSLGMHVILDWVGHHTSPDNAWVTQHPDWYAHDANGNLIHTYSDVVQLDYSNAAMRQQMINDMAYWVNTAGVDGFRCDMATGVPLDFWTDARNQLSAIKPMFMLAEGTDTSLVNYAFDAAYGSNLSVNMEGIANGTKHVSDLVNYLKADQAALPGNGFRMNYTENHDTNADEAPATQRYGNSLKAFTVLTFTAPGMPEIYNGQEAGLNQSLSLFDRDPINFKPDPMAALYRTLAGLKTVNKALWDGGQGGAITIINALTTQQVLTFERDVTGDRVVTMLNLSNAIVDMTLPDGVANLNAVFGPVTLDVTGKIILQPWSYQVWATAVPEPVTASAALLGAGALLGRRRRARA